MSDINPLYIIGGLAAAYLVLKQKTPTTVVSTTTSPGVPVTTPVTVTSPSTNTGNLITSIASDINKILHPPTSQTPVTVSTNPVSVSDPYQSGTINYGGSNASNPYGYNPITDVPVTPNPGSSDNTDNSDYADVILDMGDDTTTDTGETDYSDLYFGSTINSIAAAPGLLKRPPHPI